MKSNITMRDIANKLGVSSVTVSKALNDKEGVSEELKQKIKALAGEMGYRYNSAAKSIKDGLSKNIGVLIPERFTGMSHSFYLRVYQQISLLLDQYGYFGILNILSNEDEELLNFPGSIAKIRSTASSSLAKSVKNISRRSKTWICRKYFLISMTSMPISIPLLPTTSTGLMR